MHFASHYRWLVYQYLFGKPTRIGRLLDIGSDDGGFVERLPARMSVAIDTSIRSLQRVPSGFRVCADGTRLPFRDLLFDHVVLSDVIEHVPDDETLVRSATRHVRAGGAFWLSTTAADFTLFPPGITRRAEQSWGHVRKGYRPSNLEAMIGDEFACETVEWPEVAFRHSYLLLWLCSKSAPGIARALATLCFVVDKRLRKMQRRHGHIYIRAIRRAELPIDEG